MFVAGDWIKWSKGLATRREVVLLAAMLRRDRHEVAGRLMVFWEWLDDNVADHEIDELSLDVSLCIGDSPCEFVDALVGLPGFAAALASDGVRWLSARSGGRLTVPHFGRHNGTTAKTRALESRKKQRQRAAKDEQSPDPSRYERDNTGTRGEESKRRRNTPPPSPPQMREEQEEGLATPSDRGDALPIESEWSDIGRLLRSLGVGDPARSIAGARNGGAGPSDVLAVIAHYQASPGAWTPSLLSGRVARCAEGLASNAYWPPKAGAAARAAPKQTEAERQQREDFDAMRIVKDDRRLKKTDQQIEADLRRAGLGESVDRLDWRTKEKVTTS